MKDVVRNQKEIKTRKQKNKMEWKNEQWSEDGVRN